MSNLTCTISMIHSGDGRIEPVYVDIANGKMWTQIIADAIACGAIVEAGLYLLTAINPDIKATSLDLVITVKLDPYVTYEFGVDLDQTVNATRWPPKTNKS